MSDIRECLSRFSVMGWSSAPAGRAEIDAAIDAYLATVPGDRTSQRRAVQTLKDCYGSVVTQSGVGDRIRQALTERIEGLRERYPAAA